LFLVIVILTAPLAFAQPLLWDVVIVLAYGTNLEDSGNSFSFVVVALPTGSQLTNTIYVEHTNIENYTTNLILGDRLSVNYIDGDVTSMDFEVASEPDHFEIRYSGESRSVQLNSSYIPEFSSILVIPMFITVTLLALVYRRIRTSQTKSTDLFNDFIVFLSFFFFIQKSLTLNYLLYKVGRS